MKEKVWVEGHYEETEKEIKIPEIGDKIFVNSSYYIDRSRDDFDGGICEISKVEICEDCLPCNRIMISVVEKPYSKINYLGLLKLEENKDVIGGLDE